MVLALHQRETTEILHSSPIIRNFEAKFTHDWKGEEGVLLCMCNDTCNLNNPHSTKNLHPIMLLYWVCTELIITEAICLVNNIWKRSVWAAIFEIKISASFVWFTTVLCTLKEENKDSSYIFLPHKSANEMDNLAPLSIIRRRYFNYSLF